MLRKFAEASKSRWISAAQKELSLYRLERRMAMRLKVVLDREMDSISGSEERVAFEAGFRFASRYAQSFVLLRACCCAGVIWPSRFRYQSQEYNSVQSLLAV